MREIFGYFLTNEFVTLQQQSKHIKNNSGTSFYVLLMYQTQFWKISFQIVQNMSLFFFPRRRFSNLCFILVITYVSQILYFAALDFIISIFSSSIKHIKCYLINIQKQQPNKSQKIGALAKYLDFWETNKTETAISSLVWAVWSKFAPGLDGITDDDPFRVLCITSLLLPFYNDGPWQGLSPTIAPKKIVDSFFL